MFNSLVEPQRGTHVAKPSKQRELTEDDIADIQKRLGEFLEPYREIFTRQEQAFHAAVYIQGRTERLTRRTIEPIAVEHDLKRRPLQHFIGAGKWEDELVRAEMAKRIGAELGKANGVLILDGSGFPKAGAESAGTQRQWCGRLGKEEQCQVGEFLAYAASGSVTLVDCELYLPKSWTEDKARREKCHVPEHLKFQTGWQLAATMVERRGAAIPHRWVVGDENYGRPTELRDLFHLQEEQYLLEVPCDAKIRLVRGGDWTHADEWAETLPRGAWSTFTVRDGEKGPVIVRAVKARVYTPRAKGKGPERPEVLLVVKNDRDSKSWTYLGTDGRSTLGELVRVGSCRHGIEQSLEMAKGDVGLDEYEVRSWLGWHHHMTLSMMALWFLVLEQRWLKKRQWSLPSRRFAEFWPIFSISREPPNSSPNGPTRKPAATTTRVTTTGLGGGGVPRRASKSVRQWTDLTPHTHRD